MLKILSLGSRGPEVATVQRALNQYFRPPIPVDGVYGSTTEAAVRQFQQAAGFRGQDIDGVVGPKTTLALFQLLNIKIRPRLRLSPRYTSIISSAANRSRPAPSSIQVTAASPAGYGLQDHNSSSDAASNQENKIPKRFQASAQFGAQYSQRDGSGLQGELSLTARSRDYFPNSNKNSIYHGMHLEAAGKFDFGIPVPPGSIFTGSVGVTIQPVTDWLVLGDWHLLNPSVGAFAQWPFNQGGPVSPGSMPDPSSKPRAGFNFGLDLFKFSFADDHANIGISGNEAGYWEFGRNIGSGSQHSFHWDPSIMFNITWNHDFGSDVK